MKQFAVGYHKAIKKIVKLKYWESNHLACKMAGLMTFNHCINWQKVSFANRIMKRPCMFIEKSFFYFSNYSCMILEVNNILMSVYNVCSLLDNDIDAIKSRIQYVQNNEPTMR